MRIYEAWGDPSIGANCFIPSPVTEEAKANWKKTLKLSEEFHAEYGEIFVHLYSIRASGYVEAMTEYWRAQDWGEYVPDAWTLEQVEFLDSQ